MCWNLMFVVVCVLLLVVCSYLVRIVFGLLVVVDVLLVVIEFVVVGSVVCCDLEKVVSLVGKIVIEVVV